MFEHLLEEPSAGVGAESRMSPDVAGWGGDWDPPSEDAALGDGMSPDAAGWVWSRPVGAGRPVGVVKTPAELLVLLQRAQARSAGKVRAATPAEDFEGITSWSRLQDQAAAGLWRAISASHSRAGRGDREFLGDEVALAIGASPGRGSREYDLALAACALPGLVEAVEDGTFTQWHARLLIRELNQVPALSLEQRQAVVLIALARYHGQDDLRLAKDTARLIASIDPVAAAQRQQVADSRRQVLTWTEGDSQAALLLRGPAERIAAAKAALTATAAALAAAGADQQTLDQRMFDSALELLTGGRTGPGAWHVNIVVPFSTATGGDLELADIPGFGPILPATARDLTTHASTLRRLTLNADTGQLLTVDDPQPTPGRSGSAEHSPPVQSREVN